jgi:hypothetical protein
MERIELKLKYKIKILNEELWEERVKNPEIEDWLNNFNSTIDNERIQALYLLSNFMYFGHLQMRELLKSMYRDLFKYPIVEQIRRENDDTVDVEFINKKFKEKLERTRFLGVGNPSESGYHLLYYFRQENSLHKNSFIHAHKIFQRHRNGSPATLRKPEIDRYVFIDDFCGSGQQGVEYSQDILSELKTIKKDLFVGYYVMFATKKGLERIRSETLFDSVKCIYTLDSTFKCFDDNSRIFSNIVEGIEKEKVREMCLKYGSKLIPSSPLGYGHCELLIGFHHNIPDNTLPIIWYDYPDVQPWKPIFKRYPKIGE